MTVLLVIVSFLLATEGARQLARNRRSVTAFLLAIAALLVLVASQAVVKAVFIWLALLGLAGFVVTVIQGLWPDKQDSDSDLSVL